MRPENSALIHLLQQWGNATSITLLDPSCNIFSAPSIEGIIGYRLAADCAVVFGDPVCAPKDLQEFTHAFHQFCKETEVKSIIYVLCSETFSSWLILKKLCRCSMHLGNELIINSLIDPKTGTGPDARRLRNKHIFSQRQGMTVHEYVGNDAQLEKKLIDLKEKWLTNQKGMQAGLFSKIDLFAHRENKRYFYAQCNDTIVGLLILNRIQKGWVVNMLMRVPQAPTTTSEFLILSVLDILRGENFHYFSVGTIPTQRLGKTKGFSIIYDKVIRSAYIIASMFLKNRQTYWKKFNPKEAPTFILCSRARIGVREALGLLRAFSVHT